MQPARVVPRLQGGLQHTVQRRQVQHLLRALARGIPPQRDDAVGPVVLFYDYREVLQVKRDRPGSFRIPLAALPREQARAVQFRYERDHFDVDLGWPPSGMPTVCYRCFSSLAGTTTRTPSVPPRFPVVTGNRIGSTPRIKI